MTPDEIVKALRENAEWCDANEYDVPLCMGDNQGAAADLIESLQAELADVTAQREKGCEYCASRFGIATHHINGAGLQTGTNKIANFCPMCGKRLEVEP